MHQIYKINEMNRTEAELVEKTLDQIRKEKGAAYGESFKVRFIDIEMRSHLGRPHVRMCIDDLTASGKIDFISSKGRGGCTCSMIGPPITNSGFPEKNMDIPSSENGKRCATGMEIHRYSTVKQSVAVAKASGKYKSVRERMNEKLANTGQEEHRYGK